MELVSGCVECGLAEPESLASLGGSAPGVVDGILSGDGGVYVVMEHTPKPQQKLRQTLHFSVWVVVVSVFFLISLSLENLEQQNSHVFWVVYYRNLAFMKKQDSLNLG